MKTLPTDEQAELELMRALLSDRRQRDTVIDQVPPSAFGNYAHQLVANAVAALVAAGGEPDAAAVVTYLEQAKKLQHVGGADKVHSLAQHKPSGSSVQSWVNRLRRAALRRGMAELAVKLEAAAYEGQGELEDVANGVSTELADLVCGQRAGDAVSLSDALKVEFGRLERIHSGEEHEKRLKTGWPELDNLLRGIGDTDLLVLGARPSMGKSAVAGQLMVNLARQGEICLMFNAEMSIQQITQRMLASVAGVELGRIRQVRGAGGLSEHDFPRLARAMDEARRLRIYLDDSPAVDLARIRAGSKRLQREVGLSMVVVDYLQLMSGRDARSREREIADLSRGLKLLAKELRVPVLALSQLNRSVDARTDKRPLLSDLRESGAIEQDADTVLMLYRAEHYAEPNKPLEPEERDTIEVLVRKSRHGAPGTARLKWDGAKMRVWDPQDRSTYVG